MGIAFSLMLFAISAILGMVRIFKKDYRHGIYQTLFSLITGGIAMTYFFISLMFYPYDTFTVGLRIPQNIKFEKPVPYNNDIQENDVKTQDIVLHDYFQGGLYKYDLFLGPIEEGVVYLKIFEITRNQILSETEIKRKSEMNVENSTDQLKKFSLEGDFTVYEGNWNEFYGSRVEVWFKPKDSSKKERKLLSKNYIIQGWMR